MFSRWILLSTIIIVAASSSNSLTLPGMVCSPANSPPRFLRCPAISSYPPSGRGRALAGTRTPYSRMLSAVSFMRSSSSTLNGWWAKGCSSSNGISCTFSRCASSRLACVLNRSSSEANCIFCALLFNCQHLPRELLICCCNFSFWVVCKDALAFRAVCRPHDGGQSPKQGKG